MYIDERESYYFNDEGIEFKHIDIVQVNDDGTEVIRGAVDTPRYQQPIPEPEPTEEEIIQAEMLLNQQEILINQQSQDEVLAEILLGQQTI